VRPEEADLLTRWVRELNLPAGSVCLNIGSSTKAFREEMQPHVAERFIRPLERAGIRFVHCDMKQADGVDEVGDILDPAFRSRLKRHDAVLLVCSNLLEHLTEPRRFASACGELVRDGGFGLFSVPRSYPYHPDPIDTMLRVTPAELAAMLPEWTPIRAEELEAGNYWQDLRESGSRWSRLLRQVARVALPFYRPSQWRANASRLSWLFRRYSVSIVLLQKPVSAREPAANSRRTGAPRDPR
jgi:SAM-dependent methyltransferase